MKKREHTGKLKALIDAMTDRFSVDIADWGVSKKPYCIKVRYLCFYIIHEHYGFKFNEMEFILGAHHDHSTVRRAVFIVRDKLKADPLLAKDYAAILDEVKEKGYL